MTGQPSWNPQQGHDRLRISDADREKAAAALGEHYAQGRLTTEEHSERLDQIWAAKTMADLSPVFRDLPAPAPPQPQRPGRRPGPPRPGGPPWSGPPRRRYGFPTPLVVLFAILVAITVISNLPIILVGVAVWFVLARCWGGRGRSYHYRQQARY
jgi:hypothetical protein